MQEGADNRDRLAEAAAHGQHAERPALGLDLLRRAHVQQLPVVHKERALQRRGEGQADELLAADVRVPD